jgi:quercetin dioxygenase-like cupin family protein
MNSKENYNAIFPKGEDGGQTYFTGQAWVKYLVPNDDTFNTLVLNVVFEAGARNYWHKHPGGQILIATHGTGYYQEKGKAIQLLNIGDVVKIAPDIEHWHGASPGGEFTHIAINTNTHKGIVEWLTNVTDEEYNSYK